MSTYEREYQNEILDNHRMFYVICVMIHYCSAIRGLIVFFSWIDFESFLKRGDPACLQSEVQVETHKAAQSIKAVKHNFTKKHSHFNAFVIFIFIFNLNLFLGDCKLVARMLL